MFSKKNNRVVPYRSGIMCLPDPFRAGQAEVRWKFNQITSSPVRVVRCRMEWVGLVVNGYGDSLSLKASAIKAFSEAWERIWFEITAQKKVLSHEVLTSNGFAAGPSLVFARNRAKSELIERSMILQALPLLK